MEQGGFLLKQSIRKAMPYYILVVILSACKSIVDAIFAGNFIGRDGLAAIQAAAPVMTLLGMLGVMLSVTCVSSASILIGRRNHGMANQIFTFTVLSALVIGIVIQIFSVFFLQGIADFLSAGTNISRQVFDYLHVILLGAPVMIISSFVLPVLNMDNHPNLASYYVFSNIALNFLFNFISSQYTDLGISGIAGATVLSYLLSFAFLIPYIRSSRRMLRFCALLKRNLKEYLAMVKPGISSTSMLLLALVWIAFSNTYIARSVGASGMAVYSIFRTVMIFMATLLNIGYILIQSFAGVLYGEKDWHGLRLLCKCTLCITTAITVLACALMVAIPGQLCSVFGADESIYASCVTALRFLAAAFPFLMLNLFFVSYYLYIKQYRLSNAVGALHHLIAQVPCMLFFVPRFGLNGAWIAYFTAEAMTTLLTIIFCFCLQKRKGNVKTDIFLLPMQNSPDCLSLSSLLDDTQPVRISQAVMTFLKERGYDSHLIFHIGLVTEELVLNILQHGYPDAKTGHIDSLVRLEGNTMIVRIRDDGVLFNPTLLLEDDGTPHLGMKLIRSMSHEFQYDRVLQCNNSIAAFQIDAPLSRKEAASSL